MLDELRERHGTCPPGCLADQCRRGRCTLKTGSAERVIVDCDACGVFGPGPKTPDFVIACEGDRSGRRWVVLEMKSKADNPESIIGQLQAGANAIATDPAFQVPDAPSRLLPLVLHEKGTGHAANADQLQAARVLFRGKRFPVVVKRCGVRLEDLP